MHRVLWIWPAIILIVRFGAPGIFLSTIRLEDFQEFCNRLLLPGRGKSFLDDCFSLKNLFRCVLIRHPSICKRLITPFIQSCSLIKSFCRPRCCCVLYSYRRTIRLDFSFKFNGILSAFLRSR
jgi:hypothetical protein